MAQAARLNLRMQKELKLLLTDPPPGATFPSLTSLADSSSSSRTSLRSIDAGIEGPQGTVYERVVFKLKIQIPERYPFQPPSVMFATPIYHPNIDNGGRICLDILNLPPKGAWQPSLNISTVLTSIGLLLSEPNPDDGLMEEASREYKYNRPAFDLKARSMTEKYARAGLVEKATIGQETETLSQLNKDLAECMESKISTETVSDHPARHKRLSGVSKKLSLEASEFDQKDDRKEIKDNLDLPRKRKFEGLLEDSNPSLTEHNQAYKNSQCRKGKLQLGFRPVGNYNSLIEGRPEQHTPPSEPFAVSEVSSKCWTMGKNSFSPEHNLCRSEDNLATSECINMDENSNQITKKDAEKPWSASQKCLYSHTSGSFQNNPQPEAVSTDKEIHSRVSEDHGNGFTRIKHKKLGLAGRGLPSKKFGSNQCLRSNDKENLLPKPSALFPPQIKESSDSVRMLAEKSDEAIGYDGIKHQPINYPSSSATISGQLKPLNSSGHISKSQALKQSCEQDSCNDKVLQTKESDRKFDGSLDSEEQAYLISDSFVVLDSEDSDDEKERTSRSKQTLARRRLPGKKESLVHT